jgi:hypothetical protein
MGGLGSVLLALYDARATETFQASLMRVVARVQQQPLPHQSRGVSSIPGVCV